MLEEAAFVGAQPPYWSLLYYYIPWISGMFMHIPALSMVELLLCVECHECSAEGVVAAGALDISTSSINTGCDLPIKPCHILLLTLYQDNVQEWLAFLGYQVQTE